MQIIITIFEILFIICTPVMIVLIPIHAFMSRKLVNYMMIHEYSLWVDSNEPGSLYYLHHGIDTFGPFMDSKGYEKIDNTKYVILGRKLDKVGFYTKIFTYIALGSVLSYSVLKTFV